MSLIFFFFFRFNLWFFCCVFFFYLPTFLFHQILPISPFSSDFSRFPTGSSVWISSIINPGPHYYEKWLCCCVMTKATAEINSIPLTSVWPLYDQCGETAWSWWWVLIHIIPDTLAWIRAAGADWGLIDVFPVSVWPVNDEPGHCQHPSHPSATHYPAADKQSCHVDGLERKHHADVEINRLHGVLRGRERHHKHTFPSPSLSHTH